MSGLSTAELERYDRQMRIKEWGVAGQLKLKKARVMVAGGGGLGCPASIYLAAAGVGNITIVDKEKVELSNLNRQVLHWTNDVGLLKGDSITKKLCQLNPEIKVKAVSKEITKTNACALVRGFDVVVDCMDNWATRFILNEACVAEDVPLVHAGIYGLYGQVTTIMPRKGPCLRCILPKPPPEEKKFPVLGATPGTLGLLEAFETIKLLTGIGQPLVGRLVYFDGENMTFQEIKVERKPNCPVCGQ